MELIQKLVPVCMVVFVLSSMLAMGFGLTVGGIIAPLRDVRRVLLSLLANFLLVPLIALAALLRLDEPLGVGLLLLDRRPARHSCRSLPSWRKAT